MKILLRMASLTAALVGFTACGPLQSGGTGAQVVTLAKGLAGGAPPPEQKGSPVSQQELLDSRDTYIRVNIRQRERWDTGVKAGTNGNRVTWVDGDNISVTLDNGIVVATRGLPRDLMAADVSQTVAALRAGGGNTQRKHEFLTNLDGISTELLQCRIVSKGPEVIERLQKRLNSVRFEEKCEGAILEFTNIYWLNRQGGVIRSLQAVSPDAGYLQIDVY